MKFQRMSLETCENATGIVVVIDVLRAFSTTAYSFASGASSIILVSNVEDAFLLKRQFPYALLMGEVNGLPIKGFDYSNSPTELVKQNLAGQQLIQRTSAGTQGVTRSVNAHVLLASSFCCAKATAEFITQLPREDVTFVITGKRPHDLGDEDDACADYIENLIMGKNPDIETYIQRVRESMGGKKFINENEPGFPPSDLEYCAAVDKFNFAMRVERENGLYVMKPVKV